MLTFRTILFEPTKLGQDLVKSPFGMVEKAMNTEERPVSQLRNLGSVSASWLNSAGIMTISDLSQKGPVNAFLSVKRVSPQTSLNLLWALAAGLQDRDWRELTQKEKSQLIEELT